MNAKSRLHLTIPTTVPTTDVHTVSVKCRIRDNYSRKLRVFQEGTPEEFCAFLEDYYDSS
jgi:hypothetical protein